MEEVKRKEKYRVSKEKAIEILPDGDIVHTFRNPSGMLIGADWNKKDILRLFNEHDVEESGEQAQRINHGLVVKDEGGYLFIETKAKAV